MSSTLRAYGLRPVINATGPLTRMGNSVLSEGVIAAMNDAARAYLPIGELQDTASRLIAEATGAEAGYATPGASAGITLAVAACIAGEDPERIKSLPHITAPPDTVVMFEQHRGYYDFAVRATGARLRLVDASAPDAMDRLSSAIGDDVACVFYDCTGLPYRDQTGVPPLEDVVAIAHRNGVRVVADASMALPPAENLRAIVGAGTNAVVFTASKAMQGPAASGFVACESDMVRSMVLQNQDVDVLSETTGVNDPHNRFMGLGRSLKVGKEQIAGMLTALAEYQRRDHAGVQRTWQVRLESIERALTEIEGVSPRWLTSSEGRAPYLLITFKAPLAQVKAQDVSDRLMAGDPRIFLAARLDGNLCVGAECMGDGDAEVVAHRLVETIRSFDVPA